jgi:hypothetical protein
VCILVLQVYRCTYKYVLQVCILVLHVYILVLQVSILVLHVYILVLQVCILQVYILVCTPLLHTSMYTITTYKYVQH